MVIYRIKNLNKEATDHFTFFTHKIKCFISHVRSFLKFLDKVTVRVWMKLRVWELNERYILVRSNVAGSFKLIKLEEGSNSDTNRLLIYINLLLIT